MANIFLNLDGNFIGTYVNNGSNVSKVNEDSKRRPFGYSINDIFNTIKGLLYFGLEKNLFDTKEIKSWFEYDDDETKEEFEKLIDKLEMGLIALD